jgi:hypothetical protein
MCTKMSLLELSQVARHRGRFLAHLAKGHMRYCHTVASVRRPSVVHNWEKMLLLLDGWMDLNQTWTQCSPSGGASGLCSVFGSGSGSGSESQKSVIKCDTRKTLLLLDGWMELNQTWAQCSPGGGAFGMCSVFGSGSGSGSYDKKCVIHSKRYSS